MTIMRFPVDLKWRSFDYNRAGETPQLVFQYSIVVMFMPEKVIQMIGSLSRHCHENNFQSILFTLYPFSNKISNRIIVVTDFLSYTNAQKSSIYIVATLCRSRVLFSDICRIYHVTKQC